MTTARDLYGGMLDHARAQRGAAQREDWETFEVLAQRRELLLAESQQALSWWPEDERQAAASLIGALLTTDAETIELLGVKHEEAEQERGRLCALVCTAGAYRTSSGSHLASGAFVNTLS